MLFVYVGQVKRRICVWAFALSLRGHVPRTGDSFGRYGSLRHFCLGVIGKWRASLFLPRHVAGERTARLAIERARRRRRPSRSQKEQGAACGERAGYEAGGSGNHKTDHCPRPVPLARSARSPACWRPYRSGELAGTFQNGTKPAKRDIPAK